jgi:phospholipid/cholesterol/gamma-HCH transport system substrate-binding protein
MTWAKKIFTDKLYLSVVGVIAVFVLSIAYLFAGVLDRPLTSKAPTIKVMLTSTGGLFAGSEATYRGVKVGKVTAIKLTRDGVEADVSLTNTDLDIPASTKARVRSLSPVGEQYVDFEPTSLSGPYLKDGSVIAASSTELPQTLGSTVVAVNGLLKQIDPDKLHSMLGELATGLNGTGLQIGQIVDQGQQILQTLQTAWPQTSDLIDNAGTALDIPTSQAGDLKTLASSAKEFAAFLKDYNPTLVKQLQKAPKQLKTTEGLVSEWGAILPGFFDSVEPFLQLLNSYNPHLRATLADYASGLNALGDVLHGGRLNLALIADKDARCSYGTSATDPRSTSPRPLQTGGHCSASFPQLQRGAAHAPGPVG